MKNTQEFFQLGVTKPSKSDIKNLKLDTFGRKVLSFEEFNPEINEKTEYYLDTAQDNTEKYVAYDGSYWYTGKIGIRGGDRYLKFASTH